MAAPLDVDVFWPPNLFDLGDSLLGHDTAPEILNTLLFATPSDGRILFQAWNDAQLAALRTAKGDDVLLWDQGEQTRYIKRRPIGEWLFYVRDGGRGTQKLLLDPHRADQGQAGVLERPWKQLIWTMCTLFTIKPVADPHDYRYTQIRGPDI